MNSERFVRLKVLPRRLRVAHLAALRRATLERVLPFPSPLRGGSTRAKRASGWGYLRETPPTPASASPPPSLPTASRGEGSTPSDISGQGGRAG